MRFSTQTEAVLAAFLEDPQTPRFGLEISRASGLASGTIYPILARLEAAQWLKSAWEDVDPSNAGRPRRRLYRLTAEGETAGRRQLQASYFRLGNALHPGWSAT
jgi:PadR family transcriptional regulator, regulatory protein PadR